MFVYGFSWPSMTPVCRPTNTSENAIGVGFAPHSLNIFTRQAPPGTRSLMPLRSSGLSIGRVLLVICRKPFSHRPRILYPFFSVTGAIVCQNTVGAIRARCARSLIRNGMSNSANSGATVDMIDDGMERCTEPRRSFCISSLSPPSCDDAKNFTVALPASFWFARRVNSSPVSACSEPASALIPKMISVGACACAAVAAQTARVAVIATRRTAVRNASMMIPPVVSTAAASRSGYRVRAVISATT